MHHAACSVEVANVQFCKNKRLRVCVECRMRTMRRERNREKSHFSALALLRCSLRFRGAACSESTTSTIQEAQSHGVRMRAFQSSAPRIHNPLNHRHSVRIQLCKLNTIELCVCLEAQLVALSVSAREAPLSFFLAWRCICFLMHSLLRTVQMMRIGFLAAALSD